MTKHKIVTYLPDTLDILTQQYSDLAEPPVIKAIGPTTQEEHGLKELSDATIFIANPSTPYNPVRLRVNHHLNARKTNRQWDKLHLNVSIFYIM